MPRTSPPNARVCLSTLLVLLTVASCTSGNVRAASPGLDDPAKKDIAMQLVSSAENSTLDWRKQYAYIEDIGDGRGYTGGIIGFTSGTGDMLEVIREYGNRQPVNRLQPFQPALEAAVGSDTHAGLGDPFVEAWRASDADPQFHIAQDTLRDRDYFGPAVAQAKADGLRPLGQFMYFDAIVVHGDSEEWPSLSTIRTRAIRRAAPPSAGGDESAYLNAFLDVRNDAMRTEAAHEDTSRVDTEQRVFLNEGNMDLDAPLNWKVYGDRFAISR